MLKLLVQNKYRCYHSNISLQVSLTWDETPADRVNAFKCWDENLDLEEFEARLKDYIAPLSDEEEDEDDDENDDDESECYQLLIIAGLLVSLLWNDYFDWFIWNFFRIFFFVCTLHSFICPCISSLSKYIREIWSITFNFAVRKPKKRPLQDTIAFYRNLLKDIDDKEKEEEDEKREKEETEKKFLEALGGCTVMLLSLVIGND